MIFEILSSSSLWLFLITLFKNHSLSEDYRSMEPPIIHPPRIQLLNFLSTTWIFLSDLTCYSLLSRSKLLWREPKLPDWTIFACSYMIRKMRSWMKLGLQAEIGIYLPEDGKNHLRNLYAISESEYQNKDLLNLRVVTYLTWFWFPRSNVISCLLEPTRNTSSYFSRSQ